MCFHLLVEGYMRHTYPSSLFASLTGAGTCPGGDLSAWGFGSASEQEMIKCCRPLHVQVYKLEDEGLLQRVGWKPPAVSPYKGMHGVFSPMGEPSQRK